MFRGVVELDPANKLPGTLRFKRFVEGAFCVRIEIVADENYLFAVSVTALQQSSHFSGPVHLRFRFSHRHVPPAGQRLREHENTSDG